MQSAVKVIVAEVIVWLPEEETLSRRPMVAASFSLRRPRRVTTDERVLITLPMAKLLLSER